MRSKKSAESLASFNVGQQETVRVFKSLPKDALVPIDMLFDLCFGARLLKFLAPSVAKRESHCRPSEDCLYPLLFGEVDLFNLVAPLFRMTEND
jgi:hypothetical protein